MKFDILDNMRITYSESRVKLGGSGKGLITSLGIKAKATPKKHKKARYAIINASKKDLLKIMREFDKLPHKIYEGSRAKHQPTDISVYLEINLSKCIMRADVLNPHIYPVRTEIPTTEQILILRVCSTDKSGLKEFLVNETQSQIYSKERTNQKASLLTNCLLRKTNHNAFTKMSSYEYTQNMRQSMRNV